MRRPKRNAEVIPQPQKPGISLHVSIPELAFEMALFRMRHTKESTRTILHDYLRELGA